MTLEENLRTGTDDESEESPIQTSAVPLLKNASYLPEDKDSVASLKYRIKILAQSGRDIHAGLSARCESMESERDSWKALALGAGTDVDIVTQLRVASEFRDGAVVSKSVAGATLVYYPAGYDFGLIDD